MTSTRSRRVRRPTIVALAAVLPLAACGGDSGGGAGGTGTDPESFIVLSANENPTVREMLDTLAAGACQAENEALPLEHQTTAQADTVQKVTLLASQDALPAHFIAGTDMVRPDGDIGANGLAQDLQAALEEAGAWDNVLPAAASTEQNVYGGFVSMPYQYNIEGIWYNKQIFAEHGIEVPQTWDQLVAAAETVQQAGIIPMSQAGFDGWPLTRLLGMYIYRNVGPDAMQAIRDGEAKLTDPEYLEGAQALADFAAAGFFGEGFSTRQGDVASNMFLTGKSAMFYDGSWLLGDINDPETNQIGAENVGFMPFPAVEGGAGSVDQYPTNAGAPMAFSAQQFGPDVEAWVTCIAENYGALALGETGRISGFRVNEEVTEISPNTAEIQEIVNGIEETDETFLWFEALFDPKSNSLASTNGTLLTTGAMSAEEYMQELQGSIDAGR